MISLSIITALKAMTNFPGATDSELAALQRLVVRKLPDEYIELLRHTNGADGFVNDGKYFILYSVQSGLDQAKRQEDEFAPGLFIIGSNGGGTAFGIDLRGDSNSTIRYVEMELVNLDWDGVFFEANTLEGLFTYLAVPYPE